MFISFILTKKKSIEISSQQKYISYLHYIKVQMQEKARTKIAFVYIFNRKQLAYMSLCRSCLTKSIHIYSYIYKALNSPRSLVLNDEILYKT